MKYNFQAKAKMAAMTAGEVAVVGGSALLSQKFLSFENLFKNQIAKDPTYKDKWFIKHQGAIKFAVGVLGAIHIENPWLRMIALGIAVNGLVQEVRVLTMKDGAPTLDAIGNIDKKLLDAAKSAGAAMQRGLGAVGDTYQTMVAGPVSQQYPTQVARPVDLMTTSYSNVGNSGAAMWR